MPTFRVRGTEGEAVTPSGVAAGLRGDSARVASNVALADNMGKFVASQVISQYGAENLAELVNRPDNVAVTVSWG